LSISPGALLVALIVDRNAAKSPGDFAFATALCAISFLRRGRSWHCGGSVGRNLTERFEIVVEAAGVEAVSRLSVCQPVTLISIV
jgi:hypothetical protein